MSFGNPLMIPLKSKILDEKMPSEQDDPNATTLHQAAQDPLDPENLKVIVISPKVPTELKTKLVSVYLEQQKQLEEPPVNDHGVNKQDQ